MITNQDRSDLRRIFRKVREETAPLAKDMMSVQDKVHHNVADVVAVHAATRLTIEMALVEVKDSLNVFFIADLASRLVTQLVVLAPEEFRKEMIDGIAMASHVLAGTDQPAPGDLAPLAPGVQ
jgi:hypothetical protein